MLAWARLGKGCPNMLQIMNTTTTFISGVYVWFGFQFCRKNEKFVKLYKIVLYKTVLGFLLDKTLTLASHLSLWSIGLSLAKEAESRERTQLTNKSKQCYSCELISGETKEKKQTQ